MPLFDAIMQSEDSRKKPEQVSANTLYKELVSEKDLQKQGGKPQKDQTDSMGIRSLKSFHLQEPSQYERDLKEKIFFIGQNYIQANEANQDTNASIG